VHRAADPAAGAGRPVVPPRLAPGSGAFVALMAALMTMTAMSIDISLPAVPSTAVSLRSTLELAQLIVPAFFIGFAFGQMFWGPLSDRYGRKPMLMLGIASYVVVTFGCAASPTMEILLGLRVVQGIGAGAGSILSRTIIRDLFDGPEMARMMSLVLAAFITAPIIAPSVGALMLQIASWRAIFIFLGAYGLLLLALTWLLLEESLHQRNPDAMALRRLVAGYRDMLSHPGSRGFALALIFVFGTLNIYLTNAPAVFMTTYGLTPAVFGVVFAVIAVCSAAGNLVNTRLIRRMTLRRAMGIGIWGALVATGLNVLVAVVGWTSAWALVPGFAGFFFFFGFITANGTTLALMPHGKSVGSANSALGFSQTIVPAIIASIVAALYDGTAYPTVLGMLLLILASGAVFLAQSFRGRVRIS
jgi:DHA1 family bicyclomycin/chloramphenicol resistance-like MFS transporter